MIELFIVIVMISYDGYVSYDNLKFDLSATFPVDGNSVDQINKNVLTSALQGLVAADETSASGGLIFFVTHMNVLS